MYIRVLILAAAAALASACNTTSSDNTRLIVTQGAQRSAEEAREAAGPDAQPTDSATVEAAAKKSRDPDDVICRYESPVTGTRLGKRRICATRAEWEQMEADARAQTEEIIDGGKYCVPGNSQC